MIKIKTWFDSKFGKIPYKEVILVNFSFEAISNEETGNLQYNFLLNEEVIQAHLEFSTKKGIAIIIPEKNPEEILKKTGIKYLIESKQKIPYEKVIEENLMV